MRRSRLVALAVVLLSLAAPPAASATTDIMLLVDGSGSIDAADWRLQRDGFVTALSDPANVPLDGSVAIGVVQWSRSTRVELPLTQIDDQADLDAAKARIAGMAQMRDLTASGEGVFAGTAASVAGRRPGATPVHCMSTDGTTNSGRSLASAVTDAKARGIERFSVIGIEDFGNGASLRAHYTPHVYGGGAFTLARNTAEFATLIGGSCFSPAVRLRAMEVNQGVQDWRGSQPLVRNRTTVVRAFVEVPAGTPPTRVTGRLKGTRGGSALPGSPLAASNLGGQVLAREDIVSRRGTLDDTLNFVLPRSWTTGDVRLEFEAGGAPVDCKEPADGTPENDCFARANFATTKDLGVTFWSIMVNGAGPHTGELGEQIARTRSALPISTLTTTMRGLNYTSGGRPELETINDDLDRIKQVERTSCTGTCVTGARDVYYGVVEAGGDYGGLANGIPGSTASGHIGGVAGRTDTGYARNRAPHEIAHTLGVHHAVDNAKGVRDRRFIWFGEGLKDGHCGEVASSDAPGHTPFIDIGGVKRPGLGSITSGEDSEAWGFDSRFASGDVNGLAVVDPRRTFALMGYCKDGVGQERWTSAFEWGRALAGSPTGRATVQPRTETPPTPPPAGSVGLLVSGSISVVTGAATFDPVLRLPYEGDAAAGAGAFLLRVQDPGGATLATRRFTPQLRHGDLPDGAGHDDADTAAFAEVVAVPGGAAIGRVSVTHDVDGLLGAADAPGGAPPSVGAVTTSDSSIESSPVGVDWDGTPGAKYAVFFSPDDGDTWSPIAFDVPASDLSVDPRTLRGTADGRLAVAASNGLDGTVAQLDGITVTNAAPSVEVVAPTEDDAPPSGVQVIRFEAVAGDRDEVLPDSAITWVSDRNGTLGSGPLLERSASSLAEGKHVITARVTDAQGAQSTDTIELEVFRIAPPPPSADLALTATGPAGAVVGGQGTTIRLAVANAGPSQSRRLRVQLALDPGLTAGVPAVLDAWTCAQDGTGLVCERPRLPAGAATTLDVPVATDPPASRVTRAFSATLDAAVADPRRADNAAAGQLTVDPPPPPPPPPPATGGGGGGSSGGSGSGGGAGPGPGPGASTGSGGTKLSAAVVARQFRADLAKVRRSLVRTLRRRGRQKVRIRFLAPGRHRVVVQTVGRRPRTVAVGTRTLRRAGRSMLTLKVTKTGRRLLRQRRPPRMRVVGQWRGGGVSVTTRSTLPRR